jgi:hypothetical protein
VPVSQVPSNNSRRWLAWAIIAIWSGQVVMLWPLPQHVATSWDLPPALAVEMEQRLWTGWVLRAALAVLGILSGVLLLKRHRSWALLCLVCAAVYVAYYSQWISFHAQALESWTNVLTRVSWAWMHPGFVFMTLVFPAFLVAVSVCALIDLFRQQPRNAI